MQKHYKNVKKLKNFYTNEFEVGDIIVDNGTIAYMGKNKESEHEKIDLSEHIVIPSFKNYHCDARGLPSSEIENLIYENVKAGVTDIIVVTDSFLFTKFVLEKYNLNYKLAITLQDAKELSDLDKEKILVYVDPALDEESELDEASDFAGKNELKVFINMFDNLELVGELNSKTKKLPINYIEEFGLLDRGGYISGAICSDKEDYNLINQYDFEIIVRPMRDLRKGNGFANIIQIQNAGLPVSVGTHDDMHIDMFQIARTLLLGTRGLLCDECAINENEVLSVICTKELEEKTKANFIVLDTKFDEENIIQNIINSANKEDIMLTIANGEIIKRED